MGCDAPFHMSKFSREGLNHERQNWDWHGLFGGNESGLRSKWGEAWEVSLAMCLGPPFPSDGAGLCTGGKTSPISYSAPDQMKGVLISPDSNKQARALYVEWSPGCHPDGRKVSFPTLYPWRASGPRLLKFSLRDMNGCDQSLCFCFFPCEEQSRGRLLREHFVLSGALFSMRIRLSGQLHLSPGSEGSLKATVLERKTEHFTEGDKLLLSENDEKPP